MQRSLFLPGLLLFSLLVLVGCSKQESVSEEKIDFFVDAVYFDALSDVVTIEKTASLLDQQVITVTAQAAGRVSGIPGQEWQNVLSGQPIVQLADTIASYALQAERAKNNLERATAQEAQTRLSLEDAVIAAEAGVVQAAEWLRLAQTSSSLSLRWQELSVEQARIARDNQLASIQISFASEYTALNNLLVDVLDRGDSILGVTDKYRYNDDWFETLWIRDQWTKVLAENAWYSLVSARSSLDKIDDSLDSSQILSSLDTMLLAYDNIQDLLSKLQDVLTNTIVSWPLSDQVLSTWKSSTSALQSRTQWARWGFAGFRNQAIAALSPLSNDSLALTVGAETAELGLESSRLSSENAIINAQLALNNAERAYIQSQSNKEKQLRILATQVQDAQLAYQDALRQVSKLTVWAPVRGVLWSILVSPGQDVQMGTPLFTIVGDVNQLLWFSVSAEELPYIRVGQEVTVVSAGVLYSGQIQSVPRVADRNMQYRVVVSLDRSLDVMGTTARVRLSFSVWAPVVPLNAVTGLQSWKWVITVLDKDNELSVLSVEFGKVWGIFIEIRTPVADIYRVVLNDVGTYDANDFVIQTEQ
jgi:multidrug resistance efflux pump